MPYRKITSHAVNQRQFSVLLKVPWSQSSKHFEELKTCFDQLVKDSTGKINRTTLRLFRSSSLCRFTVVFDDWQFDAEGLEEKVRQNAEKAITNIRNIVC